MLSRGTHSSIDQQSSLLLLRTTTGPWRHLPCVFPEVPEHSSDVPSCIHVPVPDRTALRAAQNSMDRRSCSPRCAPLTAHRNQLNLLRRCSILFPEAPVRTHLARPHLARGNNNRIPPKVLTETLHRHRPHPNHRRPKMTVAVCNYHVLLLQRRVSYRNSGP